MRRGLGMIAGALGVLTMALSPQESMAQGFESIDGGAPPSTVQGPTATPGDMESPYRTDLPPDDMILAIRAVEAEVSAELRTVWGDAVRLPEQKVWVGYRPDLKTRVVVDYENGGMSVETVDPSLSDSTLRQIMGEAIKADSRALDGLDILASRIRGRTAMAGSFGLKSAPRSVPEELSALADPATADAAAVARTPMAAVGGIPIRRVAITFRQGFDRAASGRYKNEAVELARRFAVPPSLVGAIIKNESAFNPRARSSVPAFGLMQIVPRTAGQDAMRFKTGREVRPSPEYLYDPTNNIDLGTIYLHLLGGTYLDGIRDSRSRLFCVVAAYNTGAGNVARAFTGSTKLDRLARAVNAMEPEQVYRHLLNYLPYVETQRYVRKVLRDMPAFESWDRGVSAPTEPEPEPEERRNSAPRRPKPSRPPDTGGWITF